MQIVLNITEDMFEISKNILINEIDFVGITERWDESLLLMKYYLGFDVLPDIRMKVSHKPKEPPPQDVIDHIAKVNRHELYYDIIFHYFYRYDMALWEIANQKFEHQIDQIGREQFYIELEKLKASRKK
jgi:hypothetical protein